MGYLAMNLAAFAVIVAAQHERPDGDDVSALAGLGARQPWLAWPMTVAMLALAGIPGTVGFIGKFQLIHALVAGSYTWLAIVLVIGSMISLGYYLRVVAAIWMRPALPFPGSVPGAVAGGALAGVGGALPPIAGGSPEADEDPGTSGPGEDAPEVFSAAQVGGADGPAQDTGHAPLSSPRWSSSRGCSPPRPCSSGSSPRRCSTSPLTQARRSPGCSRVARAGGVRLAGWGQARGLSARAIGAGLRRGLSARACGARACRGAGLPGRGLAGARACERRGTATVAACRSPRPGT